MVIVSDRFTRSRGWRAMARSGPQNERRSISALAARYDMSFAAVQKHVAVLEGAGLVTKQTQGRERIVRGNPERVARARDLLARLERLWSARSGRLDRVLTHPNPRR